MGGNTCAGILILFLTVSCSHNDENSNEIPLCCTSETAFSVDTLLPESYDLACESFLFRACPTPRLLRYSHEILR